MLQAWRAPHPPARGNLWLGTKPLVHVGFLKSWVAGGLDQRVVGRVSELAQAASAAGTTLRIYVTGGCWPAWCGSADRCSLGPATLVIQAGVRVECVHWTGSRRCWNHPQDTRGRCVLHWWATM